MPLDRVQATGARVFADFATRLREADIPAEVASAAKLHLLDALGCGLAALALDSAAEGRRLVADEGGLAQSAVIGLDRLVPAAAAAFANGMLCHGLDFDDTHADAVCHISTVVGPAALAVAQAEGASGAEALSAIVVANEIVARLGMAASGAFHGRGFHPTSVCGVFGAAAAASRLLGLDPAATTSALGLAGSMASGLFAYLADGTATKPVHAGVAARNGVQAAQLAALGAQGPPSVLEAPFGLYRAFAGTDADELSARLDDLGTRWETLRIAYKAYPACHYMHGALGAAAGLLAAHTPEPAAIRDVEVTVPPGPAVSLVLEPLADKRAPRTGYDAKFSLPYSLAALLVHGRVGLDTYMEAALADPAVRDLAAKVRYRVRDYQSAGRAFPGGVTIVLAGGRELAAELDYQPGAVENPLSAAEIVAKFRANAGLALDRADVAEVVQVVTHLDEHDDLSGSLAVLRHACPPIADLAAREPARVSSTG